MRALIFLLIPFFVSFSCKRIQKELPTLAKNDSFEDSLPKKEQTESSVFSLNIGKDTLKKIDLPIGSELLGSHEFSKKFGSDGEEFLNGKQSFETKILHKIVEQNRSYQIGNNANEEYLNSTLEYDCIYKLVARDSTFDKKNIKIIGEIIHKESTLVLCSLIHNTLPLYSSIFLISTDSNKKVKDVLVLFDEQVDYLSQTNELFYMDTNFLITKKYFNSFEGTTFFNGEQIFTISDDGFFIRHYDANGNYKSSKERGLVKNNTREGLWIVKNIVSPDDRSGVYTYLEANFKDGIPESKWNYFILYYKRNSEGEPDITTATKGPLLFTEIYKKGEMIRRELVNDKK